MTSSQQRQPYLSDLSDARWALIEPTLTAWRAERQKTSLNLGGKVTDLREVMNAILFLNRTGVPWRYLPHDFPPHTTVFGYFSAWTGQAVAEPAYAAAVELPEGPLNVPRRAHRGPRPYRPGPHAAMRQRAVRRGLAGRRRSSCSAMPFSAQRRSWSRSVQQTWWRSPHCLALWVKAPLVTTTA